MSIKKVNLERVAEVLRKLVEPEVAAAVIRQLSKAEDKGEGEEEKVPKPKKQWGVFILQVDGVELPKDMTGWVFQVDESDHLATCFDRVAKAGAVYNTTKKGSKRPVRLTGEAFDMVPAKLFKECQIGVKTKLPIWIVPVPQKLPSADSSLD